MKLAAIYNVFDGEELLMGSIRCIKDHVDEIIIVWQDISNYGEHYSPVDAIAKCRAEFDCYITATKYTHGTGSAMENERIKRNIGLSIAHSRDCTHFLHMDVDEYYEDFGLAKAKFLDSGYSGSVCKLYTYFKSPELRFETPDEYYVPFIHELCFDTEAGKNTKYPFYVDPTRVINCKNVGFLTDVYMHHFSYVRKDIHRKVRNSTAKRNIERTTLIADYLNPEIGDGSVVKDYHNKKLIWVENTFGISI
jgi:hypothetical protein